MEKVAIKGMAPTGGGLLENVPRVLPENTVAEIQKAALAASQALRLDAGRRQCRREGKCTHLQLRYRSGHRLRPRMPKPPWPN